MYSATNNAIDFDEKDKSTRKKAMVAALVALLLWFLLLIYPVFSYTFPLPEKPGILLNFGDTNGGGEYASAENSTDNSNPQKPKETAAPLADTDEEASKQEVTARSVTPSVQKETKELSFIKTSNAKKSQEKQVKKSTKKPFLEKKEAEKIADTRASQKEKALEEAAKQKEKEASAAKEFGSFFSGLGSGSDAKITGDPEGAPNQKKLEGISNGKSNIGGGLAKRGVLYEPDINDQSQKVGRIIVRVCVDAKGYVTESKFTQRGSTSTDITLIEVAEKAASQYRFSPSGLEKQCGTISIDFKLK